MSFIADKKIKSELKKIIGDNCEPTLELEKMLLDAYTKGKEDAYESLGLTEEDLQSERGLMAWTA